MNRLIDQVLQVSGKSARLYKENVTTANTIIFYISGKLTLLVTAFFRDIANSCCQFPSLANTNC